MKLKFLLLFLLTSLLGWGQNTYTLVTSTSEIVSGEKYLVANGSSDVVNLLGYQANNNRPQTTSTYTVIDGKISVTPASATSDQTSGYEITITGSTGAWVLNDAVNGTILGPAPTGNNNYLKANAAATFTISIDGGAATMTAVTGTNANGRNIIRYNPNSGNGIFACYGSGQNDVYLFKKEPSGPTITFNANGGTGAMTPQTSTVAANLKPNTFTRTGYTFSKWNTAADGSDTDYADQANYDFSASMTLYAQWSINQYTVTYDGNGNDGGTVPATQTANYNSNITLANNSGALTKANYTFKGWNTKADGTGTHYNEGANFTIPGSDTTLYAEWSINKYNVIYNGNGNTGGTAPATQNANYNSTITLANNTGSLTRAGYTFNGWNTATDGSGTHYNTGESFTVPGSDTTLYAEWNPIFTSVKTGNWEAADTWDKNAVPTSGNQVIIATGHTVTMTSAQIRNNAINTTVNGTLAVDAAYTNNGTTTINGALQLNSGGSATGNNFVYGASGTLNFTDVFAVNNTDVYWPSASGPYNVNISGGLVTLNSMSRTVNGNFTVASSGGLAYGGTGSMLTLNGITTINSGGYFSNSPTYGSSSKLVYNTGGYFLRGNEWTDATSGAGYPNDVQLTGSTIFNPNGGGFLANAFALARDLIIDSGASLFMDYGGFRNTALTVARNFTNSGNFSLGNAIGGDLKVKGNFTSTGTFDPKTQAVFLNGTSAQTLSSTSALAYLFVDNTVGVSLTNHLTVNIQVGFSNGKISLGNYNFILGSSATITAYDSSKYFVTDDTGQLKQNVGGSSVIFPVGPSTSVYNPITFVNSGTADVIGVRVVAGNVATLTSPDYAVKDAWMVSEGTPGGSVLTVVPQWNGTDQGANFGAGTSPGVSFYNGTTWTTNTATIAGSDPYTATGAASFSPASLDGSQYFAVTKTEAFTNWNNAYFRSKISGNWSSTSTWEMSATGSTWVSATKTPGSSASGVQITTGTNVALDAGGIVVTKTEVYGILTVNNNYAINGTAGAFELKIKNGGVLFINGDFANSGAAIGLFETGGMLTTAASITSSIFFKNYLDATNPNMFVFQDKSIIEWKIDKDIPASTTYPTLVKTQNTTDLAIFRLSSDFPNSTATYYGSGTTNTFNATLQVNTTRNINFQGNGHKIFRGGIIGNGILTVNYSSGTGLLKFGDASTIPALGDNSILTIKVPDDRIDFTNGTNLPTTATVVFDSTTLTSPKIRRSGGTLTIDGMLDLTGYQITNYLSGSIVVGNGATLRTKIVNDPVISGNTLTFNTGSTMEYYAPTGSQQILTSPTYYNIIFSGGGTKVPITSSPVKVDDNGSVKITGTTTVDFSTKNLASAGPNSTAFIMDGGRLKLGTTGTQPNMQGTYNLTGGVVEFANNSATAQTIRNTTAYKYQNIEVTGNNVGNSSGNIALRPNGTFAVKNGGVFTIRQNSIKCYDAIINSGTAGTNCAVGVENNATFRTGNGHGFSGTDSSFGAESSSIDNNISNITLSDGSTVDYLGEKAGGQIITKQTGFVPGKPSAHYSNLTISGDVVNKLAGELVVDKVLELKSHSYNSTDYNGKLIVEATAETNAANVVYANMGVKVSALSNLTFENNAQLMQNATAVNTGSITMNRIFTLSSDFVGSNGTTIPGRTQYNFIISPVIDQKIKYIYPGGIAAPYVIAYKEGADWFINAGVGNYVPGKGYAIKEPNLTDYAGTSITTAMAGTPANGDNMYYGLEYGTAPNHFPEHAGENKGYNLVGNPYPSNLDIEKLYDDNAGDIEATFQFWDNRGNIYTSQHGSNYTGHNYAVYNAPAGTGVGSGVKAGDAVGAERVPTKDVKVGTAFLVRALSSANGHHLNFKNNHRITTSGPGFFGKGNATTPEKDRYWLSVTTPDGAEFMTAVVYFSRGKYGFDVEDSPSFEASDDIYTMVDDHRLIVQGRPLFEDTDVVPLGVNSFAAGTYKIGVHQKEGIFNAGQSIYLRDKQTGVITDISNDGYVFSANPGSTLGRFEILYRPGGTLATSEAVKSGVEIYRDGNYFVLRTGGDVFDSVEVFDTSGRLVDVQYPHKKETRIDASRYTNGVYVLKVKQKSGVTSKRMMK